MPSRGRQTVSRVKKQTKRPNDKQYEATLFQNEKVLSNSKEKMELSLLREKEGSSVRCVELVTEKGLQVLRSVKSHEVTKVSGENASGTSVNVNSDC